MKSNYPHHGHVHSYDIGINYSRIGSMGECGSTSKPPKYCLEDFNIEFHFFNILLFLLLNSGLLVIVLENQQ